MTRDNAPKKGEMSFTGVPDPLEGYYGKPLVSMETSEFRYLGRVIVELYEPIEPPYTDDAHNLALSIDPRHGGDKKELLKRIADALPLRASKLVVE